MHFKNYVKIFTLLIFVLLITSFRVHKPVTTARINQQDTTLKITLPKEGKLVDNEPVGKNWVNIISSLADWSIDSKYWTLQNGILHGDYPGGDLHNYAWTKKIYKDFQLHAVVKLSGEDPNSGVCIRIHPTDADNAPGYQVDMGEGYWGCLWEERRGGMIQKFPVNAAHKLVKNGDWNHYYIKVKDHHIEAWLNGVKTIDIVHPGGFEDGSIGFQLCHAGHHTILDVKALYLKEIN